jgi:hypothetical protein
MSDQPPVRGGFGGVMRAQMSEGLQRRIAEEEDREARQVREEERARAQRAEAFKESNIQGAIAMALESGESFHPRWLRGEKLGHTTSEFIAQRAAMMDVEDQRREARRQAAIRKMMAELSEAETGDTSAHTIMAERAEKAEADARRDRVLLQRGRQIQRHQTIRLAREAAAIDRKMERLGY